MKGRRPRVSEPSSSPVVVQRRPPAALTALAVIVVWALYSGARRASDHLHQRPAGDRSRPLVHRSSGSARHPAAAPRRAGSRILIIYLAMVGVLTSSGCSWCRRSSIRRRIWRRGLPAPRSGTGISLIGTGCSTTPHHARGGISERAGARATRGHGRVGADGMSSAGSFAVVTILILTFYLLVDSDSLFAAFARLFPRAERPRVEEAAAKISTKVSAWLSGQLILAGTIGCRQRSASICSACRISTCWRWSRHLARWFRWSGRSSRRAGVSVALTVSPRTALFVLVPVAQQQLENHFSCRR